MILERTFSNRVVSLRNSLPNVVADPDPINCFIGPLGTINMFYITGKLTLLRPGTDVYVHYTVFLKICFSLIGDEETDRAALPASVNFRCLVLS